VAGADEEARKRRAERLRRGIRDPPEDQPPRSPREFIEREMRERDEDERRPCDEDEQERDDAPPA
jgi:hypothetical protein